jgi:hypothetical protein
MVLLQRLWLDPDIFDLGAKLEIPPNKILVVSASLQVTRQNTVESIQTKLALSQVEENLSW